MFQLYAYKAKSLSVTFHLSLSHVCLKECVCVYVCTFHFSLFPVSAHIPFDLHSYVMELNIKRNVSYSLSECAVVKLLYMLVASAHLICVHGMNIICQESANNTKYNDLMEWWIKTTLELWLEQNTQRKKKIFMNMWRTTVLFCTSPFQMHIERNCRERIE